MDKNSDTENLMSGGYSWSPDLENFVKEENYKYSYLLNKMIIEKECDSLLIKIITISVFQKSNKSTICILRGVIHDEMDLDEYVIENPENKNLRVLF